MTDVSYYHTGSNADLIVKVAELGYITADDEVLDVTYGQGTWWKKWGPLALEGNDWDPTSPAIHHYDFTKLPVEWRDTFDVVAYDPPYKLNGTGGPADARYGCDDKIIVEDRLALVYRGLRECTRVVKPGGYLLVKCQDQVAGGRVRWMTHNIIDQAASRGCPLVERFDMPPARPQPAGRRQLHARRGSTLLIFRRDR